MIGRYLPVMESWSIDLIPGRQAKQKRMSVAVMHLIRFFCWGLPCLFDRYRFG